MDTCCRSVANETYRSFLETQGLQENLTLSEHLFTSIAKYALFKKAIGLFAELKVANIPPPASAMRLSTRCPVCELEASTIVVSAPLLLTVWRLVSLFGGLIVTWRYDQDRLKVEHRTPEPPDLAEFNSIINDYVTGGPVPLLSLPERLKQFSSIDEGVRGIIHASIELGQLWIVAHELAHALRSDFMQLVDPRYIHNRQQIDSLLEEMPLGPRTRRLWAEELDADLVATDILFMNVASNLPSSTDIVFRREEAGSIVCGGLAAALEVIFRLESEILGSQAGQSFVPVHPPVHLRWLVSSGYIKYLSVPRPGVDLLYLGGILGQVSKQFIVRGDLPQV
jgi:hypothetical protein